jgi:hypothetical protein
MGLSSVGKVPLQKRRSQRFIAGSNLKMTDPQVEEVWCPTTKYGTWIMRQNDGQIAITGNTKAVQRAVLRLIGLGMTSESEIESIPDSIAVDAITEELQARGNVLTQKQRKEVIAWWRENAEGDDDQSNALRCLGDLEYATPSHWEGEAVRSQDQAAKLVTKMVTEVIEAASLDAEATRDRRDRTAKKKAENEAKKLIDLAPPLEQQDSVVPGIVEEQITTVQELCEPGPLEQARESVPSLKELGSKKKFVSPEAESVLASALQAIHLKRNGNGEMLGLPHPEWEADKNIMIPVTDASGWPRSVTKAVMKDRFKLHENSRDNHEFFTWDLMVEMLTWFATHDSKKYEDKKK